MYDDLLINPFARAALQYENSRVLNAPREHFVRSSFMTNDDRFRFTVNGDGTMNVHRNTQRKIHEYILVIAHGEKILQRIAVDTRQVRILYNYWLSTNGLLQCRMDEELTESLEQVKAELHNRPRITLNVYNRHDVQRIDLCFAKQWVTLTFFKGALLNARMNGDFFSQHLRFMCTDDRRQPLDFSRGFRRNEAAPEELTNSEDSSGDERMGRRAMNRQDSARNSLRSRNSGGCGPPPIEERGKPTTVLTPLSRAKAFEELTKHNKIVETFRRPDTGLSYQLAAYTPPRHTTIPLTIPQSTQSVQANEPRTNAVAAMLPVDTSQQSNVLGTESRENNEEIKPAQDEEKEAKKSKKAKISAKNVQKAVFQALALLNFEDNEDNEDSE